MSWSCALLNLDSAEVPDLNPFPIDLTTPTGVPTTVAAVLAAPFATLLATLTPPVATLPATLATSAPALKPLSIADPTDSA